MTQCKTTHESNSVKKLKNNYCEARGCDFSVAPGEKGLKEHKENVHGPQEKASRCNKCPYEAPWKDNTIATDIYRRHQKEKHDSTRKHFCSDCGCCDSESQENQDMPETCGECGFVCHPPYVKVKMDRHNDLAHKDKRFKCEFCQAQFQVKQSLQIHVQKSHWKLLKNLKRANRS